MHHPSKVRKPLSLIQVVQQNREKERHDILPCTSSSKEEADKQMLNFFLRKQEGSASTGNILTEKHSTSTQLDGL
jgi:hypothetical protein